MRSLQSGTTVLEKYPEEVDSDQVIEDCQSKKHPQKEGEE
jgi:hypothetical protein